jgi:hypothetical protein
VVDDELNCWNGVKTVIDLLVVGMYMTWNSLFLTPTPFAALNLLSLAQKKSLFFRLFGLLQTHILKL